MFPMKRMIAILIALVYMAAVGIAAWMLRPVDLWPPSMLIVWYVVTVGGALWSGIASSWLWVSGD